MRAGRLNKRITIQTRTDPQDAGGAGIPTWTDLATVWASIEPLKGRELIAADAANSEVSGNIRIRYRAGVSASSRVKYGARYYDVLAVINTDERGRELLLQVREGPNDG